MNDERPIEKLLRRAAQERNDEAGAPPELHAVNRRLLQDEVARQFPPPPAAPAAAAPTFWGLVTRRWAYALGLIAVVSIAGLMLLPSLSKSKSKSLELAKNTPAESGVSPAMTSEAPAVLQPNATVLSDADSVALRASGGGNNSGRSFEPTTITTPPPAALSLARKDGEYGSSTAAKKPSADRESERLGSLVESRTESADKPVSPDN